MFHVKHLRRGMLRRRRPARRVASQHCPPPSRGSAQALHADQTRAGSGGRCHACADKRHERAHTNPTARPERTARVGNDSKPPTPAFASLRVCAPAHQSQAARTAAARPEHRAHRQPESRGQCPEAADPARSPTGRPNAMRPAYIYRAWPVVVTTRRPFFTPFVPRIRFAMSCTSPVSPRSTMTSRQRCASRCTCMDETMYSK